MGIVNGTTNYILTKMFENGMDFTEALAKATELGYAEADPTADVEGLDAIIITQTIIIIIIEVMRWRCRKRGNRGY